MIHASVRALERKAVQTLDFVAFWQDRLHENQGRCTCAHPFSLELEGFHEDLQDFKHLEFYMALQCRPL